MKRLILLLTVLPLLKAAHIDLSTYPFSNTLRSDNTGEAVYQVYWDFDANSETSSFAVRVRTTGWVGFGLGSPNGGMVGSDVVIGWVEGSGTVFFDDRYAEAEARPPIDASQDWTLVDGEEEDGYTILQFTRPWVTCDDRDRNIEANTARVVYSWNDADPADANSIQYHGPLQRGSVSLNLLGGQREIPPDDPADIQSFTIAVNNVTIPANDTTYWCYATQLPQEVRDRQRYITRFSPRITDSSFNFVHHMIIFLCTLDEADVDTQGVCFTDAVGDSVNQCTTSQIIAGWAVGGEEFVYPENVAFPIGGPGAQQHIVVEMHYDNPEGRDGIIDSSGIEIFYTTTRRQHDAGLLQVGHSVEDLMIVPPNVANYTIIGECSPECTSQYFPNDGITIFANLFHTHLLGHGLVLQHIRQNQQCGLTEELRPIDSNLQYDFNFQQFTHLNEKVTVLPGDTLILKCFYNTSSERTGVTLGGLSTRDEMCLSFLVYYPRTRLTVCESTPPIEAFAPFVTNYVPGNYQAAFATLDGRTSSLRNALNQLEWTNEQVQGLEQSLLRGPIASICVGENGESTSQNNLTDVQCRYQAPNSCNPSFTPTACCGGGAALVMNFSFLVYVAMVAIAGQII